MQPTPHGTPGPERPVAAAPAVALPHGIPAGGESILTEAALAFVADLHRRFAPRVKELLAAREVAQARYDQGELPTVPQDPLVQHPGWQVAPVPEDLRTRIVEITGPVDRKMIINALNSGADVFMADFEDSSAPTWSNMVLGQVHLRDAVARTIAYTHPATGKVYVLDADPAVLLVRPRGWHLVEAHLLVDGAPAVAALVDYGLYLFHNHGALQALGTGPYFYLPKLQHRDEAALWDDVMSFAEGELGLERGTCKATVLIETLPGAFHMEAILHALRRRIVGLNCGRWDYLFSCIKTLKSRTDVVLPDRAEIGMDRPFMRAYTENLVRICHARGAWAMGGMAAQIPLKHDLDANQRALDKVRRDKEREAAQGHDGTWVAHPALVPIAREAFGAVMGDKTDQLHVGRDEVVFDAEALVTLPEGVPTLGGLRQNVEVGVRYLAAWLDGTGCVPLFGLMEDAATAEISRTQVWQWIRQGAQLADGRRIDEALVRSVLAEALSTDVVDGALPPSLERASELFLSLCVAEAFPEFLTLPAYPLLG
jgi:malate synthase